MMHKLETGVEFEQDDRDEQKHEQHQQHIVQQSSIILGRWLRNCFVGVLC